MLDFESFRRQRSPRAFAGRLIDVPASLNETEESLRDSQLGFDRVMQKVVERKKARVLVLIPLPRGRTIVADAAQDGISIFSFGEFDDHGQNLVQR